MNIVIPFEGRVRTIIRSSFFAAKRVTETQYDLSGEQFQMTGVTSDQILILPDDALIEEGQALTDDMLMRRCLWRASSRLVPRRLCPMRWDCFCDWLLRTESSRMRSCSRFSLCWKDGCGSQGFTFRWATCTSMARFSGDACRRTPHRGAGLPTLYPRAGVRWRSSMGMRHASGKWA